MRMMKLLMAFSLLLSACSFLVGRVQPVPGLRAEMQPSVPLQLAVEPPAGWEEVPAAGLLTVDVIFKVWQPIGCQDYTGLTVKSGVISAETTIKKAHSLTVSYYEAEGYRMLGQTVANESKQLYLTPFEGDGPEGLYYGNILTRPASGWRDVAIIIVGQWPAVKDREMIPIYNEFAGKIDVK